eukprot:3189368-Rhodomonas_salina.6
MNVCFPLRSVMYADHSNVKAVMDCPAKCQHRGLHRAHIERARQAKKVNDLCVHEGVVGRSDVLGARQLQRKGVGNAQ